MNANSSQKQNNFNFLKTLVFIILFIPFNTLLAQEVIKENEEHKTNLILKKKANELKGTYQLIASNEIEYFDYDYLFPIIEKNRDKKKTVFIKLTDNTRLKILSEKEINSTAFIPIEQEHKNLNNQNSK